MSVSEETRRILEKAGLAAPGLKGGVITSNASQIEVLSLLALLVQKYKY
jgi:hypothetical protein